MTYNIRLGIQHGVERIADVIKGQDPDVVAVQEVGRQWRMGPPRNTARELSELTGLEHYDFVTTIRQERNEGSAAEYGHAVLSRWPLERVRRHDFSRDVDEPRAAVLYRIQAPDGPVLLLSTHLSHIEKERAMHGPELLKLVAKYCVEDVPFFVVGDLNEASQERVWLSELEEMMCDAAADAADDEATFPAEEPRDRIDYLLASCGTWSNYEVVEELLASDHRPVIAEWSAD